MKKNLQNSFWIIMKCCLILSTISLSMIFSSCSTPKSVRSGNKFYSSNTKPEKIANEEYIQKNKYPIEEAEKLFEKINNNKNVKVNDESIISEESSISNSSRKIPSLREQMKIYTEQQDKMLDKLTFLERDIENIKNDIEDIKITIRAILANQNDKTAKGVYGDDKQQSETRSFDNNQSGFYLYPDNETENNSIDYSVKNNRELNKEIGKRQRTETKKSNSISTEKPSSRPKNNSESVKEDKIQLPINPPEFDLAMDYFGKRDFQNGVAELTKLENNQKISNKLKTYYWLGEGYFGLGNYTKAIEYFRKVVKSGETYKKDYATIMIAESFLRIGRVEDAKKSYAKFVDEYPNSNQIPRAKKMLQQL